MLKKKHVYPPGVLSFSWLTERSILTLVFEDSLKLYDVTAFGRRGPELRAPELGACKAVGNAAIWVKTFWISSSNGAVLDSMSSSTFSVLDTFSWRVVPAAVPRHSTSSNPATRVASVVWNAPTHL